MSFKSGIKVCVFALAGMLAFAGSGSAQVDELVVTASKRQTSLLDTPVAVSVVSGEILEQANINDITELQGTIPSFKINQNNTSIANSIFIRGFGNGANNPGVEPSISVVVDGVTRTRTQSALGDLISIEQVEVIRGPQTTLFGRTAAAGVVNITTKKPEDEFGGKVSVTTGNQDLKLIKGTITGPISDNMSFRLSGSLNEREGYTTNTITGSDINNRDRYALRGQLYSEISDDLNVRIIADYDSLEERCCDIAYLTSGNVDSALLAAGLLPSRETLGGFDYSLRNNFDPENELEGRGASVEANLDIGFATFTSITSYRENSHSSFSDVDFTVADILSQTVKDEFETFTQEFRLTSENDGKFQWMVGAYYVDEDLNHFRDVKYRDTTTIRTVVNALLAPTGNTLQTIAPLWAGGVIAQVASLPSATQVQAGFANPRNPMAGLFVDAQGQPLGAAAVQNPAYAPLFGPVIQRVAASYLVDERTPQAWFVGGQGIQSEVFDQNTETMSLYAQFDYQFTERVNVSLGVGWIEDIKTTVSDVDIDDPWSALPLLASDATAPLSALQFFPPFRNYPNELFDGKVDTDDVVYSLKVIFDVDETSNFYATVSTGFKPASVSLVNNATFFAGAPFDPDIYFARQEDISMLEFGWKKRLENGYINLAVFDQSIEDFQNNIFIGTGFNLANVEEQSHRGIELDGLLYLTENFFTTFAATYIDAEYETWTTGPCDRTRSGNPNQIEGCPVGSNYLDFSGESPAGVPELAFTVSANYGFDVTPEVSGFFRAEYVFEDEHQAVDNVRQSIAAREVGMLNASLNFENEANGLSLSIWGRNINDDEYLQTAFPIPGSDSLAGYPNPPSMYGVTLGKSF